MFRHLSQKKLHPALPTSLPFSFLLYPAFSTRFSFSPLPATLSAFCTLSWTYPTHSEGPFALFRTASTLSYGFAFFSNVSPSVYSSQVLCRFLLTQLSVISLQLSLSEHFYKSNHAHFSPISAPAFIFSSYRFCYPSLIPGHSSDLYSTLSTPAHSSHAERSTTCSSSFCHLLAHSLGLFFVIAKLIKQLMSRTMSPFAQKRLRRPYKKIVLTSFFIISSDSAPLCSSSTARTP